MTGGYDNNMSGKSPLVVLTTEECVVLENLAVSPTASYRESQRARLVLAAVAGKTIPKACAKLWAL